MLLGALRAQIPLLPQMIMPAVVHMMPETVLLIELFSYLRPIMRIDTKGLSTASPPIPLAIWCETSSPFPPHHHCTAQRAHPQAPPPPEQNDSKPCTY